MSQVQQREDNVARLSRVDISSLPENGGEKYNRLIFSKSPYLLQHAENPIEWYSWSNAAFERARQEDKPVFLSIGYSTCHWCHVMAHESFEDDQVAEVLNRHYIAIKVDREERPDLDNIYMLTCQMMTGRGGWPTTLILTPDQKPFFAATYIPKTGRQGMIGLIELLQKVAELWNSNRASLLDTGEKVSQALQQVEQSRPESDVLSDDVLLTAFEQYLQTFDRQNAGFGGAPKFPAPHNLSLLLRLERRIHKENARIMALQTLQQMRLGGIFDQLGYGLHRYSVDKHWLVPHFEKMLYDQALAMLAYVEAFQVSGDGFYRQSALEIADYVRRDLTDPDGGFYCGEDADSEGHEGTFYLWTPEQVKEVLGEELATVFCRSFDITQKGNFEGRNIPHLEEDLAGLATQAGVSADQLAAALAQGRQQLFEARKQRIRPHRDDKVLTSWNGLAIAAFARAGSVMAEEELIRSATRAAEFLLKNLVDAEGRLLRRYRLGDVAIPGFLEDYAFLVWGLIELYMAGFDEGHLQSAIDLTNRMEQLFSDGQGSFFDTGKDAEAVLTRGRSLQDVAVPSGTSVAAYNLLRLGRMTGDGEMEQRGEQVLAWQISQIRQYPSGFAQFLISLDYALGPKSEIVVTWDGQNLPRDLLREIRRRFLPGTVVLLAAEGTTSGPAAALAEGKGLVEGKPAAWICEKQSCRAPVTDPVELGRILDKLAVPP
ncbi:MAG: thioredoxin domain-containing protein [Syntrophotaleaceae bacterium]